MTIPPPMPVPTVTRVRSRGAAAGAEAVLAPGRDVAVVLDDDRQSGRRLEQGADRHLGPAQVRGEVDPGPVGVDEARDAEPDAVERLRGPAHQLVDHLGDQVEHVVRIIAGRRSAGGRDDLAVVGDDAGQDLGAADVDADAHSHAAQRSHAAVAELLSRWSRRSGSSGSTAHGRPGPVPPPPRRPRTQPARDPRVTTTPALRPTGSPMSETVRHTMHSGCSAGSPCSACGAMTRSVAQSTIRCGAGDESRPVHGRRRRRPSVASSARRPRGRRRPAGRHRAPRAPPGPARPDVVVSVARVPPRRAPVAAHDASAGCRHVARVRHERDASPVGVRVARTGWQRRSTGGRSIHRMAPSNATTSRCSCTPTEAAALAEAASGRPSSNSSSPSVDGELLGVEDLDPLERAAAPTRPFGTGRTRDVDFHTATPSAAAVHGVRAPRSAAAMAFAGQPSALRGNRLTTMPSTATPSSANTDTARPFDRRTRSSAA